jgi:periplasmic protein TonB
MVQAGFFAQKRNSPTSLAMVLLLHAGVLGAVIMIKGPQFIRDHSVPTVVTPIPIDPDPPPVQPPRVEPEQQTHITRTPPIIDTDRRDDPIVIATWDPPRPPPGTGTVITPPPPPLPPPPVVRRAAELDPRFAGELQPPYPAEEHRAQREGRVQVRVTIAANGRVSAIMRLMATSEAFWRVTERQALDHWRFRPATVDGRPVADSKVMTLRFRLVDQ